MDVEEIVEAANANQALMDGTTGPIERIIAENDLVYAVWQDEQAERGVATLIIKGRRRLEAIASELRPEPQGSERLRRGGVPMRWSAVQVNDYEMAIAAGMTLGDLEVQP